MGGRLPWLGNDNYRGMFERLGPMPEPKARVEQVAETGGDGPAACPQEAHEKPVRPRRFPGLSLSWRQGYISGIDLLAERDFLAGGRGGLVDNMRAGLDGWKEPVCRQGRLGVSGRGG